MVRIPSEYQEVEYIESTGTQYIVTDVMPAQNLSFHCKYRPNSNTAPGYGNAFGSRKSSSHQEFQLGAYKGGCVCVGTRNITGHINVNKINVIDFDGETTVTINGIECSINTSADQHNMPICLFSISENVSVGIQKQAERIYELSFSNIANFIPCYHKTSGEIGMYDTVSKQFYTNHGTGTFLKGNDVTYDPISLLETRRKILLNTPHIESASGSIASFNTDLSANLADMKIHFHPVQEGTGDPSPDNVRPITGWDGLTVRRCGKNLYSYLAGSTGQYQSIELKAGQTYTVSCVSGGNGYTRFRYVDDTISAVTWVNKIASNGRHYITVTPSKDVKGAFIFLASGLSEPMIELGSTATTYEPYTSLEIPISFGRTIYGGYVDLVNGEVVEEYGAFEFTGDEEIKYTENWNANGNYYVNTLGKIPFCAQSDANNIYCNIFKSKASGYFGVNEGMVSTQGPNDNVAARYRYIIWGKNGFGETTAECKAKLKELYDNGTPLTVVSVYAQAFITTYSLTPQTIKALKGINNIWSDANGDIEVKFWKH